MGELTRFHLDWGHSFETLGPGWGKMSEQDRDPKDHESKQQSVPMTPGTSKIDNSIPLPKTAEAEIAKGLKHLYGQMLAEPMPEKFASLLDQLARLERKPEQPT